MSTGPTHKYRYKNLGLDSQELRRRREEEGVQLRKQKREQQLSKRRNVPSVVTDEDSVSVTDEYSVPVPLPVNITTNKLFNVDRIVKTYYLRSNRL